MSNKTLNTFNQSLYRCTESPDFLDIFYKKFIAESKEIKDKFKNTDMARQKRMLLYSLANMVVAYERPEILKDVATKHGAANLNITPDLYITWLECLLQAAKISDPYYNDEVERSWRIVMQNGIDYLISQNNHKI